MAHRVVAEEEDAAPDWSSQKDFWVGLRLHWRRSTVIGLLDLGALLVLLITLQFYWSRPEEYLRWLVGPVLLFLLVWVGMQLFLFPLLINNPELPYTQIAKQAVFLVLAYPYYSLTIAAVLIALIAVSIVLAGPVLLLTFSLLALVQTITLRTIRIQGLNRDKRKR